MTFAVRTGRRRGSSPGSAGRPTDVGVGERSCLGRPVGLRAGFTLLEIVLTISLLVLLAGTAVFALSSWREGKDFAEGVRRFESLLRRARVEAALNGRRIRIEPDADTGRIAVTWEADPLAAPGEYTDCTALAWAAEAPGDVVRVTRCELTGPSAYRTLLMDDSPGPGDRNEAPLEPITFSPGRTSDSAVVELAPLVEAEDDETAERAVIELDGLTGTIATRLLNEEQREAFYEELSEREQLE